MAEELSNEVVFDESEVEPIVVDRWPGSYAGVVIFDESEVDPVVGSLPKAGYAQVLLGEPGSARPGVIQSGDVRHPWPPNPQSPDRPAYEGLFAYSLSPSVVISPYMTWRTTGPEDRPAWWPVRKSHSHLISYELQEAWKLPPPDDLIRTEVPLAETQVLSWLRKYSSVIEAAERRWHVDRRAIAAAIAWEALENVVSPEVHGMGAFVGFARSVGPGKVHYDSEVVREVEASGALPTRTASERMKLLADPEHAVEYIAAIMNGHATIAADLIGADIRQRVDILANEYHGRSLGDWTERLIRRQPGPLVAGNPMALWAAQSLPYLEFAVGLPNPANLRRP